jgi:RNA polymerase sigma factor (sigma-70 family)
LRDCRLLATFCPEHASNQVVARLGDIDIPADLLRRACQGDEAAQGVVYTTTAPATFALIRRVIPNRAMAEDLFQETMMTLFERLADFRGEAPLGAWLRQIAVSKCLMFLRSPWHRVRLHLETDAEGEMGHGLSPLVTPAPGVESLDVEKALATLSPTARAVVWLYEVEGYSHEEIARYFGRSLSFSKSQLARAHTKLREWFEPGAGRQTCTSIQSNSKVL